MTCTPGFWTLIQSMRKPGAYAGFWRENSVNSAFRSAIYKQRHERRQKGPTALLVGHDVHDDRDRGDRHVQAHDLARNGGLDGEAERRPHGDPDERGQRERQPTHSLPPTLPLGVSPGCA